MTFLYFSITALFVIGSAICLAFIGYEIAEIIGLGESFVGSFFHAFTTSLPEITVSFVALRLGAVDMAVADILGSNMFNIVIIFLVDLFFSQGAILSSVSSAHLITAVVAVVMSLLVIIGLRFRQKRKTFIVISWYSPALIALYIFGAYTLFKGFS